jgi:hypothetical protein
MPMNPRLLVPRATFDPDAAAYLRAVEAADGQALETPVKRAVDDFFKGCKADGIWDAIKASCILCGARTLAGALVPLAGTAPTNNNFVDADYNRETGLVGNRSTKYLNSNRLDTADPTNDRHIATYATAAGTLGIQAYIESYDFDGAVATTNTGLRKADTGDGSPAVSCNHYNFVSPVNQTGFFGASRNNAVNFDYRYNGAGGIKTVASIAVVHPSSYYVFASGRYDIADPFIPTDATLAFYSIGASLDIAFLDARVTALVTSIGAAI